MPTLTERANNSSAPLEEAFKVLRENLNDEAIELVLEGPNIIFTSKTFEFRVDAIKYKPHSDHKSFENMLGQISVVFEGENIDKLKRAVNFVFQAARNNVFLHQENEYTHLKIV